MTPPLISVDNCLVVRSEKISFVDLRFVTNGVRMQSTSHGIGSPAVVYLVQVVLYSMHVEILTIYYNSFGGRVGGYCNSLLAWPRNITLSRFCHLH